MPSSSVDERLVRVRFAVYDPPAPGLPWLSVCLGPNDQVLAVQAFASGEAAKAKSTASADRLAGKFSGTQVQRLSEAVSIH